jgi:general secretion pathway protein K
MDHAAMKTRSSHATRGAAIVLAMLLAALAAAVAVTVFADQQRWSRTTQNRRDQVQAQALALAGVQWGRQILYDDAQRSTIDHLREPWAMPLPAIPLDNGHIRGAIEDAQGRLNVNALGETSARADLERERIARLFAQRGGPVGALDAIADWIDRDTIPRGGGAEDAFYAARASAGLPANAPVLRVAELSEVKGVTPKTLTPVAPFLTALPPGTPLNVNTASPEVLAAVVDKLRSEDLAKLVAARAQNPFNNVTEFRAQLPSSAVPGGDETLSVKSDFFYVTIEAQQGATLARARALLRRKSGEWPEIVWQVVE